MGKMLLLSFENSEDDVISEILSILENKQMKICENKNIKKCLEFQGLTINAERRLAVKGNKEIEFTFTEFEILILLAQNAGMVFSKEKIYKIVWKYAPINTNEITEKLLQTTNWSPKTIQTLIKRLVTKGVLTYEKQSRVFVYTPLVKECEYISQESNSFLNRYYNGDITSMLSAYIENDKLSETEIETLRSLLSKSSKKGGD